jgi:hypothetical protein
MVVEHGFYADLRGLDFSYKTRAKKKRPKALQTADKVLAKARGFFIMGHAKYSTANPILDGVRLY